jgi:hypothetical protein
MMQIVHRISIASSPVIRAELEHMGILVRDTGLVTFELNESYQAWPQIERWVRARGALDITSTRFSRWELSMAKWLELVPAWQYGYPQPREDAFGYLQATYDLSEYCRQCGTGLKQKAPFQMTGEPKWGRYGILQLNWVFDEYFAKPEVWKNVFEPRGIAHSRVLSSKGAELDTVVQLIVDHEIGILTEGLAAEKCMTCSRVKYVPVTRGFFPGLAATPTGHMVKTSQYFGSGASAGKRVLISRYLANALESEKIRGVSLRPVAEKSS